jgi:hypothetical protein
VFTPKIRLDRLEARRTRRPWSTGEWEMREEAEAQGQQRDQDSGRGFGCGCGLGFLA